MSIIATASFLSALAAAAGYSAYKGLYEEQNTHGGGGYSSAGGGNNAKGSGFESPLMNYNTDFTNSDAYKSLQNSLSSASAAANPIDLSSIIADYKRNNQATIDTYNKTLNDTINTLNTSSEQSRNDLLTSLKRFQESNAENMRMQQQDFNASRASLEDESFMRQRNAMANASSRGLGGSGLQQLAQLQNRIAAGKDISSLAQKNQNVQDALRKALSQKQEDYDTNISNLEKNLANKIIEAQNATAEKVNAANTNTTNLINNLIYNEQVRQRNAQAQASNTKIALNNLLDNMKKGVTQLQGAETALNRELENKVKTTLNQKGKAKVSNLSKEDQQLLEADLNKIYVKYLNSVSDGELAAYYGLDNSYIDTATSNLANIYNRYTLGSKLSGSGNKAGFR